MLKTIQLNRFPEVVKEKFVEAILPGASKLPIEKVASFTSDKVGIELQLIDSQESMSGRLAMDSEEKRFM